VIAKETSDAIALRGTDGKMVEVRKADITRRDSAPSGMPEVYGTLLTKSELRDVVEFLASLRDREETLLAADQPRALRTAAPKATKASKRYAPRRRPRKRSCHSRP
jgi:hypothetical protein